MDIEKHMNYEKWPPNLRSFKDYNKTIDLRWRRWLKSILGEPEFEQLICDLRQRVKDFEDSKFSYNEYRGKYFKRAEVKKMAIDLLKKGWKLYQVSQKIHFSPPIILGLLTADDRKEIKDNVKKTKRQERIQDAKSLRERGYDVEAIAGVIGVTKRTIWSWFREEKKD